MKKVISIALVCLIAVVIITYVIKERPFSKEAVTTQKEAASAQVPGVLVKKLPDKAYLTDLNLKVTVGEHMSDTAPDGEKIALKGKVYEKGLSSTSNFEATCQLKGAYKKFSCVVGHDRHYPEYGGLLVFRILVDDKEVYKSKPLKADETDKVNISVRKAQKLTLSVKDNGIGSHYVLWADTRLTY